MDDNFDDPNSTTYMNNGMQVTGAAFNTVILGQGGSGLGFAFAPEHGGIGPATSGSLGELGNWSYHRFEGGGNWTFTPAGGNFVGSVAANNGFTWVRNFSKALLKGPSRGPGSCLGVFVDNVAAPLKNDLLQQNVRFREAGAEFREQDLSNSLYFSLLAGDFGGDSLELDCYHYHSVSAAEKFHRIAHRTEEIARMLR
jgi:hypothetical protein